MNKGNKFLMIIVDNIDAAVCYYIYDMLPYMLNNLQWRLATCIFCV